MNEAVKVVCDAMAAGWFLKGSRLMETALIQRRRMSVHVDWRL